jgi:tetratricopeptide (TPR) repeat protein
VVVPGEEPSKLLNYGRSLYDLRRYADAEAALRGFVAYNPQNWMGHYYLGCSLLAQSDNQPDKIEEGLKEAQKTVTLCPDIENGYFLLTWAHLCRRKPIAALSAVHQGMRINPQSAWGYSLTSRAHAQQRDWSQMLLAAQAGLKISPDHNALLNSQAEALIMLNRKEEARIAIEMALHSDPSSSYAHKNYGWLALYNDNPMEAFPHFREALRLDPTSDSAHEGLLQSLHAHNPLYRWVLNYSLWSSHWTRSEFWWFISLLLGSNCALGITAIFFPPVLIVLFLYIILFIIFAMFTWINKPLFNLLLCLSPTGRMVLSKDDAASATGCGFTGMLSLINIVAFVAACFLYPYKVYYLWVFFLGAALSFAMTLPLAGIFRVNPIDRRGRRGKIILAAIMGVVAVCAWGGSFSLAPWHYILVMLFVITWFNYAMIMVATKA